MKKLFASFAILLLSSVIFAQTTSQLFTATYKFATEKSDAWEVRNASFKTIDLLSEQYVFTGSFAVKLIGMTRYDFTCSVVCNGNDFSVTLSNVSSIPCDKNWVGSKSVSPAKTPDKVSIQYAAQMKTEIQNRLKNISESDGNAFVKSCITNRNMLDIMYGSFSLTKGKFVQILSKYKLLEDEEIITNQDILLLVARNSDAGDFARFLQENNLINRDEIVTNTKIISAVAANSTNDLQFERFLTNAGLIGKKVTLKIDYKNIETKSWMFNELSNYKYIVSGEAPSAFISLGTNDEKYIDYKEGKEIEITGTIAKISNPDNFGVLFISIAE